MFQKTQWLCKAPLASGYEELKIMKGVEGPCAFKVGKQWQFAVLMATQLNALHPWR